MLIRGLCSISVYVFFRRSADCFKRLVNSFQSYFFLSEDMSDTASGDYTVAIEHLNLCYFSVQIGSCIKVVRTGTGVRHRVRDFSTGTCFNRCLDKCTV